MWDPCFLFLNGIVFVDKGEWGVGHGGQQTVSSSHRLVDWSEKSDHDSNGFFLLLAPSPKCFISILSLIYHRVSCLPCKAKIQFRNQLWKSQISVTFEMEFCLQEN